MIEFGVLGPLTLHRDHEPVALNAAMLRQLLVLLLQRPGQAVPVSHIMDTLWPDQPPTTARKTLQVYVGRLRKVLGDEQRIRHCPDGYLIMVAPDELDVLRFEALVGAGRDARRRGSLVEADAALAEALRMWRGRPFADLDARGVVADQARRLEEQWLAAHEIRAAVRLDQRREPEVVTDLAGLLSAHPYQERLVAYLMLALYRSDRQTEALDLYRRTRDQLAEELGIEPGPTVSWLHGAILRTDPRLWALTSTDLDAHSGTPLTAAPPQPAAPNGPPAQLPPDVYGFTGRGDELKSLDALLGAGTEQPTAVVISAVSGTAGVGKTALAVHWAHRVKHHFPDGQLYVNLRGFDSTGAVMAAEDVVRRFLDALAVPPRRIPADPGAQADLYRTLLADKRMLVLLDNARDPGQVRPLLPGATGCLVLVTSRNRLTSLVAAEGAQPLALDLLAVEEARDLLTRRLGPDRVAAEPDAVDVLIARCARLPLALAIVAAIAATRPDVSLAAFAEQLHDSRARLDALSTRDTSATDLRAVFSWSYQDLGTEAARLFRLLGLHPGPDCSVAAAASLAARSVEQVRPLLRELVAAHLVNEHTPGRYHFHDLLRAYAAETARATDPDDDRRAANARTVDHYLWSAHAAARLLDPVRDLCTLSDPEPGLAAEEFTDNDSALGWFTAEHRVLLAAVDYAGVAGLDKHCWQLAWSIDMFLYHSGHWNDLHATKQAAVEAAARSGDLVAQARAHRHLARVHLRLDRLDQAHIELRRGLDLTERTGDRLEEALLYNTRTYVWAQQGSYTEALADAQHALELLHGNDDRQAEAFVLNTVGWYSALLGQYEQGLAPCQQAHELFEDLGDWLGLGSTCLSLGFIHRQLGDHGRAVAYYQRGIDLYRDIGARFDEAVTLTNLGDAHQAADDPKAARASWAAALTILEDMDLPMADEVRARLHPAT